MKLPNGGQRLLHRFFMIQLVTEFFSTRLHHIDRWILAITGGRQTITGWMGWTIIQLHTTGAKSGRARQTILIGVVDGDRIVVIASNFGRSHHPAWHHNLEANPANLLTSSHLEICEKSICLEQSRLFAVAPSTESVK